MVVNLKLSSLKRIIYCLLVAVVLSACGCTTNRPDAKNVGDIVNVNGKLGVVIATTLNGQHGLVMSVKETKCSWDEAQTWCANIGHTWRLPSIEELLAIYKNRSAIDSALSAKRYKTLNEVCYYWSSNSVAGNCAWHVHMLNGDTDTNRKYFDNYVRAVSAF